MASNKSKVSVVFVKDYTVKDESSVSYVAGKQYEMSEDSANHFVRRGLADVVASVSTKKSVTSTKGKDSA